MMYTAVLDYREPPVPIEIFSLSIDDPDLTYNLRCTELWGEVCEELLNQELMTRSHHNVATYDAGCRGPLCRKAHREHPRRKAQHGIALQVREERIYDPVLDYFHTVMKHRIRRYQQELLKEIS